MGKTMCGMGEKKRKKYRNPTGKYACKKCGERVNKKDLLCKPQKEI